MTDQAPTPSPVGGASVWRPPTNDQSDGQGPAPSPELTHAGQPPYAPVPTLDPALVTALPVEERTSSSFARGPRWRWWKPLAALVPVVVVAFICMGVPALIGLLLDGTDLMDVAKTGGLKIGPWGFLGNNVGLALLIPLSLLAYWVTFGQRPRWLSSVGGGFRWGWFARCLAVVVPLWAVMLTVEYALGGLPADIRVRPYTVLLIVGILLTTPLQAAGEEYLMRGLEQRMVASYFKAETLGWIVATIVSSLTFMALHSAKDPWLNLMYLCFGASASWVTWKTGGLEAAVAIHVVNNLLSEVFLPFTDFSGMFERGVGTGDPTILIQVGVLFIAAALLTLVARRSKVVVRSAPGRQVVEQAVAEAQASGWGWGRPGQPQTFA